MNHENTPKSQESFSDIEKRMTARGFGFSHLEPLTQFKFDPADALFKTVPLKTKEQVIEETTKSYTKNGHEVDVELVDEVGLSEKQAAVFVFVKKKVL